MRSLFSTSSALALLAVFNVATAAVTIYTTIPGLNGPTTTSSAPIAQSTENSAYNNLVLTPPDPPGGLQTTLQVTLAQGGMTNLSMPLKGNYLGFSVELSIADQILGTNSTFLSPIFLNYMANIRERIGMGPLIRVGGNTQDESFMFQETFLDSWGHLKMIQKSYPIENGNPTETPNINYAVELFYTMANITALVGVEWYFGLQFDQPYNNSNAMVVAKTAEAILGDSLIAFQLGNEPDLYASHSRRNSTYGITDYMTEFQDYTGDLAQQSLRTNKILLGPSICCDWTNQDVFNAGYLTQFAEWLKVIAAIHYPNNNCAIGGAINPQDVFANYLTHQAATTFVGDYADTAAQSQAAGLPFVILETNTASCGGFPGVSDSFGAALWAIDNALQLATINTTSVLLHVGGQHDSYNPFTPPPSNISKYYQWTTGAVYYSVLAVAETLGSNNASQVADLNLPSEYQPGYAIYENGTPTRLALINFVNDASGASDYNVVYSLSGGTVPATVSVRYLEAPTVSEKYNITWAGQTLGGMLQSDGRMNGNQTTSTINCDQTANTCTIPVKAPSFALVFLTNTEVESDESSTLTFATTAYTAKQQVLVNPSVLATMNGEGGTQARHTGSTSKNASVNTADAVRRIAVPLLSTVVAAMLGCVVVVFFRA